MRAVLLVLILLPSISVAEYRAFQLRIEKVNNPAESREILATLDPLQYPGYYSVKEDEKISYVRTWMCFGRTNGKAICPDPEAPKAAGDPATETAP